MMSDRQGRLLRGSASQNRLNTPEYRTDQNKMQAFLQPVSSQQNTGSLQQIPFPENAQFSNSQMKFMNEIVSQQPVQLQQIVGQQLLQLTPEEVVEIQRKLQQGEIIQGLSSLPQGVNPTHKFIVKIRKPYQQKQIIKEQVHIYTPPKVQQQFVSQVQSCQMCPIKDQQIRQQEMRIDQLLIEMNKMSQFLMEKTTEIDSWKLQCQTLKQEYQYQQQDQVQLQSGCPQEDPELKFKLDQMEQKNRLLENQLQSIQTQQRQQIEQYQNKLYQLESNNVSEEQIIILKESLRNKNQEIEQLRQQIQFAEQQVRVETKYETKVVYKPDPDTLYELEQLQSKYRKLEQQYQSQSYYQQENERYQQQIDSLQEQLRRKNMETVQSRVETKIVYKPDPDTLQELEQWKSQYRMLEQKLVSVQEQYSIQIESYQTKIYQFESKRSDNDKYLLEIDSLKEQLRRKSMEIEALSRQIYETQSRVETKIVYKPDPDTLQELEQWRSKYRMMEQKLVQVQEQFQIQIESYETKIYSYESKRSESDKYLFEIDQLKEQLRRKSMEIEALSRQIYETQSRVETKIVYKPDPDTLQELEQWRSKYRMMEQKLVSVQEQFQIQIESYETKIYSYESKRSESDKYLFEIDQLKEQLRRKSMENENLSRQIYETQSRVETKIVYKPDPDTLQELEQLRQKYRMLEQKLVSVQDQFQLQIESYQTKIYQFESKRSENDKYLYEIEQLKEQLKRKTLEIQQLELSFSQKSDIKIREIEQLLLQREDRIRQLNSELERIKQQYEGEINQYKTSITTLKMNSESNYKTQISELKDQINMWRDRCEQIEQKQQISIQSKIRELNEELLMWKNKCESIEQRFLSLQQSYETIQITMREIKESDSSEILKLEISRLQKTIIELRSEIDRLLVKDSDNQWLSSRYEEQQHLLDQFKAKCEQRNSIQNEYTYEVQTKSTRPSEMNRKDIQQYQTVQYTKQNGNSSNIAQELTTQQFNTNIQQQQSQQQQKSSYIFTQEPQKISGFQQSSYITKTVQEPTVYRETTSISSYNQKPQIAAPVREYVEVRESTYKQSGPQVTSSYYNSKGMNLLQTDTQTDQLRKSRALQDSRAMRWNDDYNAVIDDIVRLEKGGY